MARVARIVALVFFLLIGSDFVFAKQCKIDVFNVKEIIKKENLSLKALLLRISKAEKGIFKSTSVFLPTISVGAYYQRVHNHPQYNFADNNGYYLEVSQLLFSSKDFFNFELAKKSKKSVELSYDQLLSDLVYQARELFLLAVFLHKTEASIETALNSAKALLLAVRERYKKGEVSEYEYLRAQEEVSLLEFSLSDVRDRILGVVSALKVILGLSDEDKLILESRLEYKDYNVDLDSLKRMAVLYSPLLKSKKNSLEIASYEKKKVVSDFLPRILLSYKDEADKLFPMFSSYSKYDHYSVFKVVVNLPLFEGGRRIADMFSAEDEIKAKRLEFREAENKLKLDLETAFDEYKSSKLKVKSALVSQKRAYRLYEIVESRYKQGLASYLDLLDSRSVKLRADANYYSALKDYYLRIFKLEKLVGREVVDEE